MNKKGFTLVELIATIAIILLLGLIVTPKVMNVINENRIKGYEEIERRLEEAAGKYIIENYTDSSLPFIKIEKNQLIEGKYIDEIYDLKDKSVCDAYVIVSDLNNVASFKPILNCSNYISSAVIKLDVILNQGTSSQEFASEYNTGEVITLETPTKLGYNFAGWEVTSGNSKLNENVLTIGNMDTIVSALWEEKEYILTVNPNKGSLNQKFKEKYKSGETINLNVPTRKGYVFIGWEVTTGNSIISGNTFTMGTEDTVITAIWGIAQAIYTGSDNTLAFILSDHSYKVGETYDGKTITNVYTRFETTAYTSYLSIPWYSIRENVKNVVFTNTISPIKTAYWFYEFKNCESLDVEKLDTSNVTDMQYMFFQTGYNATTFNIGNLDNWDTSNVTDMSSMFDHAGYNAETFNVVGLDSWNTSNVTDMSYMFFGAGRSATTWDIGNLSNWDTSNVTNMKDMFYYAGSSATTWNIGNLSNWDTSNVTNMYEMFQSAGGSAPTFNIGDLSNWNVSKVTAMDYMFFRAGYAATSFNIGDLSNWNVSNVTNMNAMFEYAGRSATTFDIGDLSGWNTANVTDMSYMFHDAGRSATTWDIGNLSNWDTSNVTNMKYMFDSAGYSATTFNIGDLSNWNTSNVTDMSAMFDGAGYNSTTFNIGNIGNWDTSNVTNMSYMFTGAGYKATYSLDLSSWNVNKVTSYTGFNTAVTSKVTAPIWVN